MHYAVVSTSLNPNSRSYALALEAAEDLKALGHTVDLVDLRQDPLPLCDGNASYDDPAVEPMTQRLKKADGILLASAVYTYDVNAAAKNLVEMTGEAWEGKVVGFLLAAGGMGSYMSVMSFASSLMLDFRCLILPRFVYALKGHFSGAKLADTDVRRRVKELAQELDRVAGALAKTH
jgi:FMN reductase